MEMSIEEAMRYVLAPTPFDEQTYLEAGIVLVNNRDKLTHEVFYKIPDPGALTTNDDPKWNAIKNGSSGERCSCGNCRTIWPLHLPEFKEGELITLKVGDKIYILPKGSHYRHTEVLIEIVSDSEKNLVHFVANPFSDSINFSDLFSPKGYVLAEIASVLASKKDADLLFKRTLPEGATDKADMTLLRIKAATAESITLAIGDGYVTSKDPEAEGVKPIDINPNTVVLIKEKE